jgi:hypothetical protein
MVSASRICPVYVAESHMRAGTLVPVRTSLTMPFGALSLVWPPKVRAFVDFVVKNFAAGPRRFPAGAKFVAMIEIGRMPKHDSAARPSHRWDIIPYLRP